MSTKQDEILNLAKKIMENIENDTVKLSNIARQAQRMALLRRDKRIYYWLELELYGHHKIPKVGKLDTEINEKVVRLFWRMRSIPDYGGLSFDKVMESFRKGTSLRTKYITFESLASLETCIKPANVRQVSETLNNVRNYLYQYASRVYYKTKFDDVASSIFDGIRKVVDETLLNLCPVAVERLVNAVEKCQSLKEEDWSAAALSCRRVLKDFANTVFPPQDKEYKGHKVGKEDYVNRIWAYIGKSIESGSNKNLIQANLKHLGEILDCIYDLDSKGVHADVTKEEGQTCVIRTYLLLGDLARYGDIKSAMDQVGSKNV